MRKPGGLVRAFPRRRALKKGAVMDLEQWKSILDTELQNQEAPMLTLL